jgi:hypothetical protein
MNPRKEKTDQPMASENTTFHFSLANTKADPDYHSLPRLLRQMADRIDELGDDAIVRDLRFELDEYVDDPLYNPEEEVLAPSLTVFYSRQTEGRGAASNQKTTTDDYTMNYFSTTVPEEGSGGCGVPKLLRRVAGRLDELGDDSVVYNVIMHAESDAHSANTYRFKEYTDD